MKIEPGSYTDQKIKHKQNYDKMIDGGWVIKAFPGEFDSGKFGMIKCSFRYWTRKNKKTGELDKIPFFGFI